MSFVIEEERHSVSSGSSSQAEESKEVTINNQTQVYALEQFLPQPTASGEQPLMPFDPIFGKNEVLHPRSKSVRGSRPQQLEGAEEGALYEKMRTGSVTDEGGKFDRKRDRMSFKEDQSRPAPVREYVNGVPLLLDLNEILNLDVISMAMREQASRKSRHKRRKVLKELNDEADPNNIQIEEQIVIDEPLAAQNDNTDSHYFIDLDTQVLKSLTFGFDNESSEDDEDSARYESDEDDTEEEANKVAMEMMLSGEHPDTEIDKLLESFGVQLSQIGLIPIPQLINGEVGEQEYRKKEELREQIDEVRFIFKNWTTEKITDKTRKTFLMKLAQQADTLGVSLTVEHLLPGLLDIIQDKSVDQMQYQEYIKALFSELGKLISFLAKSEISAGYNGIRDYLTPLYSEFFLNGIVDDETKNDLMELAMTHMVMMTKVFMYEDRADKILPILLELLKDDEEKRIAGLELLDVLAADFGPDICQNYLMYEIVSLQDDPRYKVRKETVKRIVNISKVVSSDVFLGVLLPVFKKLCTDHIWGVRRQAVEVLPEICKLAPDSIKNNALLDIFKNFTQDSSKWVKQAATQFLGPFIVCYQGLNPSPELLLFYIKMVSQNIKPTGGMANAQNQEDILYHCSFNFPAVLLTLGPSAWTSLKAIHEKLVRDSRVKVRKTLAYSLFELAKILGPQMTETELLPVLFHFMKDVDLVRDGVMLSLPDFIEQMAPETRESYVDKFATAWVTGEENWRKRQLQAKQMGKIAGLLPPRVLQQHYLKTFFEMLEDQVAQVRETCASVCYPIAKSFSQEPELINSFMEQVRAFKQSRKYTMRQTFIIMCESVIIGDLRDQSKVAKAKAEQVFTDYFLTSFIELQSDRIVNVRLQVSQTLALVYECKSNLQSHPKIMNMVRRLRTDSTKDIKHFLRHIELAEDPSSPLLEAQLLEQEEVNALIADNTMSPVQQSQLERTKELLEIVQSGNDRLLIEIYAEKEEQKVEISATEFLGNIYDSVISLRGGVEEKNEETVQANPDVGDLTGAFLEKVYKEAILRNSESSLLTLHYS